MLQSIIRFHSSPVVDSIIKVLIALGLQVALGPVVIDVKGEIPITLQSFVILLGAIAFGWRIGTAAVAGYILAGAIGFPVFAGHHSGMGIILGQHGGFIFGFVAASLVCGYLAETEMFSKAMPSILNWVLGHLIILLFGGLWLSQLDPEGWQEKLTSLLPGAIIKSAFGALLLQLVIRFMKGRKSIQPLDENI
ncbi:MAG: biotin transporter BioY [Flavobacteriales bacterium]|jgi:biotin transport system substrate-specific component